MKQWDLIFAAHSEAVDSHSFIPGIEVIHWQGREVFSAVADGLPAFNEGGFHFLADVEDCFRVLPGLGSPHRLHCAEGN